ncbi:GNAT family N-acetyltransferase [Pseudoduganella lutea]|uniref:GNAT family N-acetyltransferase n=1 Tax=Pseudoduganella lutea TaxID=321985 RepID=A0A4P6L4T6_9BURK|nr:GNAT family N-acetyltransferase [Pseudoduganella lutea]QBE66620.1 GNAT family N-acetyltransferase [Pseudoduganella lutea]
MHVTLESVTIDNFEVLMDMELPPEQARYLASNAYSIAQAHYYADWRPRAIYCDGIPARFALYDVTGNDEPGHYAIYRLMVDYPRQNQGIGRRAMALILSEIRACADARRITICYKPENATARRFYASLGFAETGIDALGEMVAEIVL